MRCPHCHRTDVHRISRSGVSDAVHRLIDRWPYHCRACNRKFYGVFRVPQDDAPPASAPPPGPSVECREKHDSPTAAVVIRADSNEQLTAILLALSDAVDKHKQPAQTRTTK
jgi:hypothetical protein